MSKQSEKIKFKNYSELKIKIYYSFIIIYNKKKYNS